MQMHIPRTMFQVWLLLALTVTLTAGTMYGAIQHQIRTAANDPQIQIAQDTASALTTSSDATTLVSAQKVDMAKSLAPFTIVYDDQGKVVTSSAMLNGQTPIIPSGVLDYTRTHGEDRLTWQPQAGVRDAIVVVHYSGANSGFVLTGRSLSEVEVRVVDLTVGLLVGWLVTLIFTLAAAYLLSIKRAADQLQNPA